MRTNCVACHLVSALTVAACGSGEAARPSPVPASPDRRAGPEEPPQISYGEHDVVDAGRAPPEHAAAAKSVGLIMRAAGNGSIAVQRLTRVRAEWQGKVVDEDLCDGTPYKGNPTLGTVATVTVVGPDLVLTARHAVCDGSQTNEECAKHIKSGVHYRVAFGWSEAEDGSLPRPTELEIYDVKGLYAAGARQGPSKPGDDWAIVEVGGCIPPDKHPAVATFATAARDMPIFTFAHPFGTPLRYAGCANIRQVDGDGSILQTTIDAVSGFSGAPVLVASPGGVALVGVQTDARDLAPPDIRPAVVEDAEWKWPRDVQPPECDTASDCCSHYAEAAEEGKRICCDDQRVRTWTVPETVDARGCAVGSSSVVLPLPATPEGCLTLPTCRVEGCCDATLDASGVAYFGLS